MIRKANPDFLEEPGEAKPPGSSARTPEVTGVGKQVDPWEGVKAMACRHRRLKSVNCELFCLDCGAKIGTKKETTSPGAGAPSSHRQGIARASRARDGEDGEKPKRRTRKGATKE